MQIQGTSKPTGIRKNPPRALSSWEDVPSIEDIPSLLASGRIEPNANVKITARMRAEPERHETDGMRPRLYDALSAQAGDQIRFDGEKTDASWLYGDKWVIEIPARRFESVWGTLQSFVDDASFDAEIGPPVPDYSAPPTSDGDDKISTLVSPPSLLAGGIAVAGIALLYYRDASNANPSEK